MAAYSWTWMAAAGLALTCATSSAAFGRSAPAVTGRVQSAGEEGESGAPQASADDALTSQIKQRLQRNRLFRQADIVVETRDAVVTLAGSVPSELAHSQAIELARSTPGVMRVEDQLRVLISSPDAPAPER